MSAVGMPHRARPDLYPKTWRDAARFIVCGLIVDAAALLTAWCLVSPQP